MDLREIDRVKKELTAFIEGFKDLFGRKERRHWCQAYISGLLLDGERKSIEPLATRLPGGNEQAIQQFVNQSPWEHEPILKKLMQEVPKTLKINKGVLVLDDTTLPKKGEHSVGVGRQYCGALGKISNCQSIVTWHLATKDVHFPVYGQLYLPKNWSDNPSRCLKAGVPETRRVFKKKWEIALDLLEKVKAHVPYEVITFDAGYGECKEFLKALDERGDSFVGQIPESHSFWSIEEPLDIHQPRVGRPRQYSTLSDKKVCARKAKDWGKFLKDMPEEEILLPLKKSKKVYAKAVRVCEVTTKTYRRPGPERWLLILRFSDHHIKYMVSNLPAETPLKQMVLWGCERWKIEQGYQHLKEELGFDHFEGRSWRGLHHHMTLCFMAYCFLLILGRRNRGKKNKGTYPSRFKAVAQPDYFCNSHLSSLWLSP